MATVILIDLPTFPKGVFPLGLAAVAAALPENFDVRIIDLNITGIESVPWMDEDYVDTLFVGLKVSSQNHHYAQDISGQISKLSPFTPIIWGGEYPTLQPDRSLESANSIVQGSFEEVAERLIRDLQNGKLETTYRKLNDGQATFKPPRLDLIGTPSSYYTFMGLPMETSRGCDRKCTFCMVHTMQPKYGLKSPETLTDEIGKLAGKYVNVVDYNIGVSRDHVIQISQAFENSGVLGWMAEMCLDSLDDDEMLEAMARSRCRMIYCGLESVDEDSLRSVNKAKTNPLKDYERIIRKVQSHGIQIGAGLILGLEGTTDGTFERTVNKFSEWGIAYTKLTFLTYNPGTKVKESMRRKGAYLNEEHKLFDGNHLTFVPHGVEPEVVFSGAKRYINQFYGLPGILKRTRNSGLSGIARLELILFNICYREVYLDWIKHDIFKNEKQFRSLLDKPFRKPIRIKVAEYLLSKVRKLNMN